MQLLGVPGLLRLARRGPVKRFGTAKGVSTSQAWLLTGDPAPSLRLHIEIKIYWADPPDHAITGRRNLDGLARDLLPAVGRIEAEDRRRYKELKKAIRFDK